MELNIKARNTSHVYREIVFDKIQRQFSRQRIVFQQIVLKQLNILMQKVDFGQYLAPDIQINSELILDLSIKPKTIKGIGKTFVTLD